MTAQEKLTAFLDSADRTLEYRPSLDGTLTPAQAVEQVAVIAAHEQARMMLNSLFDALDGVDDTSGAWQTGQRTPLSSVVAIWNEEQYQWARQYLVCLMLRIKANDVGRVKLGPGGMDIIAI
jgi:hypothetical protein